MRRLTGTQLVRAAAIMTIVHGVLVAVFGFANRSRWADDLSDPPVSEFVLVVAVALILILSGVAVVGFLHGWPVVVAISEGGLVVFAGLGLAHRGEGARFVSLVFSIAILALLALPGSRDALRRHRAP